MKKLPLAMAALLLSLGAHAAGEDRGKNNHEEGSGGHGLHEAQKHKSTPESARQERESQKNLDRGKDNHEEGVGGHGLHEAKKMKPASKEQMAQKRENEKSLDRGKDNHEEGTGGHGLHEATKKK